MTGIERDQQFRIRMTAEEMRMLKELARRLGLTASDVARQLVRREHAAVFGAAPTKRGKGGK